MMGESGVVCREQYGLTSLKRHYLQSETKGWIVEDKSPRHTSLVQVLRTIFLPQGYPDSVSGDYLHYQLWDTVQAFASSLSGSLATHSLLHAMGVGDENATVLAATMTWLLKDGTGMVGRIVFAWMKGTQLDCDAKRWRLFADIVNDFALCLEIVAPLTQPYFLPVVCVAGVCKSLVGVAGGCTRAALTQHQARRNNMADVSAKDGSQETVVNLAALLTSFVVLPLVAGHLPLTWLLFLCLTALHVFANYRAVRAVRMESLNQGRLHVLMDHYLSQGQVPSIGHVNLLEPVLWAPAPPWTIRLGASFSRVSCDPKELSQAYCDLSPPYLLSLCRRQNSMVIVLSPQTDTRDQLQAAVQAELLRFLLSGRQIHPKVRVKVTGANDCAMLRQSYEATLFLFPRLESELRDQGWNTQHCLLGADEWRASWDFSQLANRKDV